MGRRAPWAVRFHRELSLTPWVNLSAWVAYALHVRHIWGRWPMPMIDCPRGPFVNLLDSVAVICLLIALVAVPFWLYAMGARLNQAEAEKSNGAIGEGMIFIGGWAVFIGLANADPVGFVAWLID